MLDTEKMINLRDELISQKEPLIILEKLEKFKFSDNPYLVEDKFPIIYALIDINDYENDNVKSIVNDIKEIQSFKIFLNDKIKNLLEDSKFNEKYVRKYVVDKLYPYYKNRYRINMSRELSLLPLDIRLFIYNELLQEEEDLFTCMNYLDRIGVTCSKIQGIQYRQLASIVVAYNWLIKWGKIAKGDNDICFRNDIYFVNNAFHLRKEIFNDENKEIGEYLEEFFMSISNFSNLENINDINVAKMLLPILNHYFKDIPNIQQTIDDIGMYFETKDNSIVIKIQNMRNNYNVNNNRILFIGNKAINLRNKEINEVSNSNDYRKAYKNIESKLAIKDYIDKNEDLQELENLAYKGYTDAEYLLGECYYKGKIVKKDYKEAMKWLLKAAEKNHMIAQHKLGVINYQGFGKIKDYKEAIMWFEKAAKLGNTDSQNHLGECYLKGHGVIQNSKEAVKWFKKAAERSHPIAQCSLGISYLMGNGIKQDNNQGIKWLKKSAEQDYPEGQYNLGVCYLQGIGVREDLNKAIKLFKSAAFKGDIDSKKVLLMLGIS